jgi:hypothetical protein
MFAATIASVEENTIRNALSNDTSVEKNMAQWQTLRTEYDGQIAIEYHLQFPYSLILLKLPEHLLHSQSITSVTLCYLAGILVREGFLALLDFGWTQMICFQYGKRDQMRNRALCHKHISESTLRCCCLIRKVCLWGGHRQNICCSCISVGPISKAPY